LKPQIVKPLPHFDTYTVDFDSSNRPECFHLFWRDKEVATIRLAYDSNGFLSKAIRQDTRDQKLISLKELANLPFFTAYIHRINLIDEITLLQTLNTLGEITNIKNIENIESMDLIDRISLIDKITSIEAINDIKTAGGINLVIDKLTQNAFTEDRRTLSNNGATPTMAVCGTFARGKFFPRGCRGFINTLQIYCDNLDASNPHTLTIKITPLIGYGKTITKTLVLSASTSAGWQTVTIAQMWNFDSMFIWVQSDSNTYGRVSNDSSTPYDYYFSSDGLTWTVGSARYWFKVNMVGETVGDLPVSGTLNTINIPAVATIKEGESISVPDTTLTSAITIEGAGQLLEVKLSFNDDVPPSTDVEYVIVFYVDGSSSYCYQINNRDLTQSLTATSGRASNGEFYQSTRPGTYMNVRVPIKFQHELEIKVSQTSGHTLSASIRVTCNLL